MVVGLEAATLTGLERAWLRLVRPAGIILFRRNIENAAQTQKLLAEATRFCRPNALRCVDLEGGTVDRLRDALAPMPSAQAVARAAQKKPALATAHGTLVARAIQAFGFNTPLAPVLDLGLDVSTKVMGTRTAGATPEEIIAYAGAFLDALTVAGVAGCGKHFPGLGGGTLDSHTATPSIDRSMKEIWRQDLAPYRALRDRIPMVMISHAAYPQTAGKATPASVSRFWVERVLRVRIGYRGLVFSDDIEMGGILQHMSIEEAAVAALRAGTNLIEICHSPELILRAYEGLLHEAEHSQAFRSLLLARARQTERRCAKLFAAKPKRVSSPAHLMALAARIRRFAATVDKYQSTETQ
jgi:beta-N-acetylhexosaminidase